MITPLDLLKSARAVIADPAHWTQGYFARRADGTRTSSHARDATCWCSLGALNRAADAADDTYSVARCLLDSEAERRGESGLAVYNDNHTHAEVLDLWDTVIARLEQQP